MRIALIKPPATYADWYRRPLLGISYLSAFLKMRGFDCKIFDAYFHRWPAEEVVRRVVEWDPHVVGLTAMTHEIKHAAVIAEQIRAQIELPIVVGGCHATALPEQTLEEFPIFDYAVFGEGETPLLALMQHLEKPTGELQDLAGVVFRRDGEVVKNASHPFLTAAELDEVPGPDLSDYFAEDGQTMSGANDVYALLSSRGCPHSCAFCMQVLGRKIRRRSNDRIMEEINHAIQTYGVHTFDFVDEVFLVNNRRTRDLLNRFIDSGLSDKIRWSGSTRANYVKPELLELARRAGCVRLGMGVESGDDSVLEAVDKRITIDQVRSAVAAIKEAGIGTESYYILGHPNETRSSALRTVKLAAELNTDTIAIGLMVPYPGTRIYDMARKGEAGYRLLSTDWSQYDKYGGRVLELEGLSWEAMARLQKLALLGLYVRNGRVRDCADYVWTRRRALVYFAKKKVVDGVVERVRCRMRRLGRW